MELNLGPQPYEFTNTEIDVVRRASCDSVKLSGPAGSV